MLPDSKRSICFPSVKVSAMAEIRPLGLISRNQGPFWVFLLISVCSTLEGWAPGQHRTSSIKDIGNIPIPTSRALLMV